MMVLVGPWCPPPFLPRDPLVAALTIAPITAISTTNWTILFRKCCGKYSITWTQTAAVRVSSVWITAAEWRSIMPSVAAMRGNAVARTASNNATEYFERNTWRATVTVAMTSMAVVIIDDYLICAVRAVVHLGHVNANVNAEWLKRNNYDEFWSSLIGQWPVIK